MHVLVAQQQPGRVNLFISASSPVSPCVRAPALARRRGAFVASVLARHCCINRCHLASRVSRRIRKTAASAQPICTSTGSIVRTPDNETVRWGSYVSLKSDLEKAVDEAVFKILASIGADADPELAVVFVSAAYGKDAALVVKMLRAKVPSLQHIYGCSSAGVIGGSENGPREVEAAPGLSVALGRLPGVKVTLKHTLRSGMPTEDCGPDKWEEFLGIQRAPGENLHFMLLAEPNFNQIQGIRQGLDSVFPLSAKIGGVVSAGTTPGCKGRHMFCWSASAAAAGGSEEGGDSSGEDGSVREVAPQGVSTGGRENEKGEGQQESWLSRGLRNMLKAASSSGGSTGARDVLPAAGGGDAASSASTSSSSAGRQPGEGEGDAGASRRSRARRIPRRRRGRPRRPDTDADSSSEGVFLYGAVLMMLQGNIQVDVLVSEGVRFLSDKTWRVAIAQDNVVYAVVEDQLRSNEELQEPLSALLGHIQELMQSGQLPQDTAAEILDSFALALGPPAEYLKEASGRAELEREDFTPMEVSIDQQQGALMLSCDVNPGVRLRLMVRDEQGAKSDLQEQLLAYKRQELSKVMQGRSPPPAFAAFLLTDVERGVEYYGEEGGADVESSILASYLPMPLSGAFLASQFAWHQKEQGTLEVRKHAVVAILRASSATYDLAFEPAGSEDDEAT